MFNSLFHFTNEGIFHCMLFNVLIFSRNVFIGLAILLTIFSANSSAEQSNLINEYSVKKLTAEDGFVSSEIYSIIQDKQGFIWFGTAENGVMRYDGRKVTLFEFDDMNPKGLSHNDAGNVMLDKNGQIWIGTWGGGANVYNPKTGRFKHFIHDALDKNSISSNRIQSLFHDQTGNIWLGSYDKGLNKRKGDSHFERIEKLKGEANSLSHNRIWDIEDHNANSLWVATSFGLNLFNKATHSFTNYLPEPANRSPTGANEIRSILKISKNKIYVGTQKGPFTFNPQQGSFTQLLDNTGQNLGQVNSMIEDHDGYIWFVTSKGVFRQSKTNSKIENLDFGHNNGLRIIFEDSSNALWITSEIHGIFKLTANRKFNAINSDNLQAPNGISIDANGDLLILTSSSELFKWQVSSEELIQLSAPIFTIEDGYGENRLLERPIIYASGNESLWLAQDEGLAHFNLQTKQVDIIKYPEDDPNANEFRELRALNMDKNGILWIGTYKNGVYLYDTVNEKFNHLDDSFGLSHPEVLKIFKDNQQNMWVGTGNGVNIWNESTDSFFSFDSDDVKPEGLLGNIIQDIHQSADGSIWIATQKGLNLYLPESSSFKKFNTESGLSTTLIRAITDDHKGNLWLTTNKGVSRLVPSTGEIINYEGESDVLGLNYYANSLVKSANETLFTSSQRGIEYFNTSSVEISRLDANLVLTGFNKMGQPVKLDTPYSYISEIQLSHLDYFFSFEFSVLDFYSPNKNQYAYKLEGYDDNWIDIGNRNTASFTNLDGGTYQFLVRAKKSSGEWSEKQLSINLIISPPPWKTWWAYSLYLLSIAMMVFIAIYLRTRLQQTEIKKQKHFVLTLEEQVNEKTASLKAQAADLSVALTKAEEATQLKSEFLANMSHEIRTPMNGVLGMLNLLTHSELSKEQKHHVDIANSSANSLLTLINDILDLSKIEAGKLQFEFIDFDLRNLLEKLTESMVFSANNNDVEIILDLTGVPYSMVKSDPGRMRQIITNLLSNAIKFTEQGEIVITAKLEPSKNDNQYLFTCKVQDTGIGIPQEKKSTLFKAFSQVDASTTRKYGGTGLGLSIIQKLCNLLEGDVTVSSELGTGSCFEVTYLVDKSKQAEKTIPTIVGDELSILIVDDNKHVRELLCKQLRLWGIDTIVAENGEQALLCCRQRYSLPDKAMFDMVLIDADMPKMNGEALVKNIRAVNEFTSLPLVMMTSINDKFEVSHYKSIGVSTSFTKPVITEELVRILNLVSANDKVTENNTHEKPEAATGVDYIDSSHNQWPEDTRILLVEDNRVNQMVAISVLKNIGLTADIAVNGKEALKALKQGLEDKPFTLVIMDCQMPVMDGYEATNRIRNGEAGEANKSIPIIAITAHAMQGDKERCINEGMDDYLTKPIQPNRVLEMMTDWINKSR